MRSLSMAWPAKPEHGGQQGHRPGEHHQHREDRAHRETVHEWQVDHEQPEQGDDDRAAREQDRAARGAQGDLRRRRGARARPRAPGGSG